MDQNHLGKFLKLNSKFFWGTGGGAMGGGFFMGGGGDWGREGHWDLM